ncbi:MAG: ferredoxin [Erysipelotrichaceae bacterium]|nr:ferredoxin [Erysipelotrichaceae bacterium]
MRVFVKDEKCIGCGSCVSLTEGNIFDFDEETGKAFAKIENINVDDEGVVKTAMEYCPTSAIAEKADTTLEK